MASMDNEIYNFTGGVNIEPQPEPRNIFQRFVRGVDAANMRTAERQERSRNPLYDMQKMMTEQVINDNALKLSDALYQKQLGFSVRGGQQKLNILFANSLGRDDADPNSMLRDIYGIAASHGLTDKEIAPYVERAEFMAQHRAFSQRLGGGAPQVGNNQTVTTKFKDPVTGTEYTVQDKPDPSTPDITNLNRADELLDIANRLEGMGMGDDAKRYRENAKRLQGSVERVDRRAGSLRSKLDTAEVDLEGLKALAKEKGATHKIQTLGQNVGAAITQKEAEVRGLRKQLAESEASNGANQSDDDIYEQFEQWQDK